MRPRIIIIIVTTIVGMVLASCGADATDEEEPDMPVGRDGVVLEIREEGGFIPVEISLTRVPRYVVFVDGTVVRHAIDLEGRAGGRAFPLFRSELDDDSMDDLLAFVSDLGLADVDRVDVNEAENVADAPTTVLTYFDEDGPHQLGVYALGFDDPADPRAAILNSMLAVLQDATTPLGEPYQPDRYEVLANSEAVNPQQDVLGEWPLDVEPAEMQDLEFSGWRCTVVEAAGLPEDLIGNRGGVPGSVWTHEDTPHTLLLRPLFPHERSCEP